MITNQEDFNEMSHDTRRALVKERDKLMEQVQTVDVHLRVLNWIDKVLAENEKLNRIVEDQQQQLDIQQQQLDSQQQQLDEAYMKLVEMNKLSTGMARKSSEDNLLKALRTYVNRSKRKTADKRAFAKSAVLEISNANGLDLPEDLKAAIESLDDEQVEPKIAIQGDYVVEKKVNQQVDKIESGAIGMKIVKEDE